MTSKALVALGVLLATVLLISSEVAAREVVNPSAEKENEAGVGDQRQRILDEEPPHYGPPSGGYEPYPGGGQPHPDGGHG